MSEILETTTIEDVEAPPPEPLISLTDLLAGVGWLAYQGTKLAVGATVAGAVLAYKGASATASAINEIRRNRLSCQETDSLVADAPDARAAMARLVSASHLDLPEREAELWKAKAERLVAANDKVGVASLARELVMARQDRLQTSLLSLAADSCREIGFTEVALMPANGILVAKNGSGKQRIQIEVAKAKEGEIRLHFDADGFHAGTCVATLDRLMERLRARGVRFGVDGRRRKRQRPVSDGLRIRNAIHVSTVQ